MPAVPLNLFVGQLRRGLERRWRSASDRRDDADHVTGFERGRLPVQIPDVVVVHVHVDEAPELPLVGIQVLAQVAVTCRQP